MSDLRDRLLRFARKSQRDKLRALRAKLRGARSSGTRYPRLKIPALTQQHIEGARLFADRLTMIELLRPGENGAIAEVGVAFGQFSEVLLDVLKPIRFVAIDSFRVHEGHSIWWGKPAAYYLQGKTHLEFYRSKFADHPEVEIEVGLSDECLARLQDHSLDLIYIDAGHDFESVTRDTRQAVRKIRQNGTLIFNDYIIYDHVNGELYGVVPVVNDLVAHRGWRVVGLALQNELFCDIALCRA